MNKKTEVIEKDEVVIRFSGDSGDGMQLTGTLFSDTAALFGNDLSTFPDYPAEIRALPVRLAEFQGSRFTWGILRFTLPATLLMCWLQ
jgi:2-oxoglutarate/2-oxoacid ferredoxin oxidoreductase subunit alpha